LGIGIKIEEKKFQIVPALINSRINYKKFWVNEPNEFIKKNKNIKKNDEENTEEKKEEI
jgi:hypothetical protein